MLLVGHDEERAVGKLDFGVVLHSVDVADLASESIVYTHSGMGLSAYYAHTSGIDYPSEWVVVDYVGYAALEIDGDYIRHRREVAQA